MTHDIFNIVWSIATLQGYAHRMKRVKYNQKVQTQLNLGKEILALYHCRNYVYGNATNQSASSPCLT